MTSTLAGDTLAGLAAEFAKLVDRLQQVDLIPATDDDLVGLAVGGGADPAVGGGGSPGDRQC